MRYTLLSLLLILTAAVWARPFQGSGFSLVPPAGWTEKTESPIQYYWMGPNQGKFTANLNVMVQTLPKGMGLDGYLQASAQSEKQAGATTVRDKDIVRNGLKGRSHEWRCQMQGRQLHFLSIFFVKGGKAYLLTGTSLDSKYAGVVKDFEASAASFQVSP